MSNLGLRDIPLEKSEDEALGLTSYAESLSEFIVRCDTPLTIALQGDWGSGKTSMMNLIKLKFDENENNKILTIWFNTWQYSQFDFGDDLPLMLMGNFINAIGDEDKESLSKSVWSLGRKIIKVGAMAAGVRGEAVDELLNTDAYIDPGSQIKSLKEKFVDMVAKKLQKENKDRIVVFIDDLDRLIPIKAVELLEVFKLFLDIPGCVYVLACDYKVVSQGLKAKFGVGSGELKGKSFFDKIIQLPFNMPVGRYDAKKYIEKLLNKVEFKVEPKDIDKYEKMISSSIGFNPRSIKRLFNSMLLQKLVAQKDNLFESEDDGPRTSQKERVLFGILCLQMAYEPVYNYLLREVEINQDLFDNLKDIDKLKNDVKFSFIRQELGDTDDTALNRLSDFMQNLFDTLQLDDDETLDAKELDNFVRLLNFSKITSTVSSETEDKYSLKERKLNREFGEKLAKQINSKYELKRKKIFKIWQWNKKEDICIYREFTINGENFQLEFLFQKNYMKIGIHPDPWENIQEWFNNNMAKEFPDWKKYDDKVEPSVELEREDFIKSLTRDAKEKKFEKFIFDNLDKIWNKLQNN